MNKFLLENLKLDQVMYFADIGAAAIAEIPTYNYLLTEGFAHLYAFEGDSRQIEKIKEQYGSSVSIHREFLSNGEEHTLYIASSESGMTSLLKPNIKNLGFFNNFLDFGRVFETVKVSTKKLDEISEIPNLDFLKMDVQGSELNVLSNGKLKLMDCLAIQLEVSFVTLYEGQATFGEIDVWMRKNGYVPHMFESLKKWSIAPTIFSGNFRVPGNQLLEADIVYIKNPIEIDNFSVVQLKKMALFAHYLFKSVDLSAYFIRELVQRGNMTADFQIKYYESLA
jgi:hypothetical protein